ncbi:hypothetical protein HMPREF1981_00862 [Bacteroides pyogenes F0041]|uniref:Uncharacterized protein n=1 Tax=Bacteroides pyogenes F0041 TaxID=1321819 RepID=U2E2V0_9BACE|nr:hypothetical protein HMPREF1981_00862 [Bacteroides pyogenes F0041]
MQILVEHKRKYILSPKKMQKYAEDIPAPGINAPALQALAPATGC